MNVLIVFAHPESQSFYGVLKNTAVKTILWRGGQIIRHRKTERPVWKSGLYGCGILSG